MNRKRILSIGGDATIFDSRSQLRARFLVYDSYHDFTLVILAAGKKQEITVGNSKIIQPGGSNKATAFFATLRCVMKLSAKEKFDVITTQDVLYSGVVGYVVAKMRKVPLYVQMHGDYLDNERWFKSNIGTFNRLMNIIGKYILKRADQVRAVSLRLKNQLVAEQKLDVNRVVSIPIGTDTSMFVPPSVQKREPVIAFAQRLILEKQPMLFVRVTTTVMQQLPDVRVVIAGEGSMQGDMQAAYETAGLSNRVTFLGRVAQADLVALYQSATCYLHTADWEGWGMPMIEAMSAGCPVVTTDTGCAGEAIRHEETGLVTPIDDETALSEAVQQLFTNQALWQKCSEQGIIEASEWSFKSLAKKNMEWYANAN